MTRNLAKLELLIESIKDKCSIVRKNYQDYSDDTYELADSILNEILEVE